MNGRYDKYVEALMRGHSFTAADTRVKQLRIHDAYVGQNQLLANTIIDMMQSSNISLCVSFDAIILSSNPTIMDRNWRRKWHRKLHKKGPHHL